MSKFKRKRRAIPPIPTSSLPDVIFIMLFFFMVIVTLRDYHVKLEIEEPAITERQMLSHKTTTSHIYVGKLKHRFHNRVCFGPNSSRIQLNDQIADIRDIRFFLERTGPHPPALLRPFNTVVLKADGSTKMGVINDVKNELRKSGQLKMQYQARKYQY